MITILFILSTALAAQQPLFLPRRNISIFSDKIERKSSPVSIITFKEFSPKAL